MSRRAVVICAVLAAAGAGGGARAAAWKGSAAFQTCLDAAKGVDMFMQTCAGDERDRQDKRLNTEYAARLAVAPEPLKGDVKEAQRAWIAYRDTTCEAEGAVYDGGTLQRFAQPECVARLTSERADWLKGLNQ